MSLLRPCNDTTFFYMCCVFLGCSDDDFCLQNESGWGPEYTCSNGTETGDPRAVVEPVVGGADFLSVFLSFLPRSSTWIVFDISSIFRDGRSDFTMKVTPRGVSSFECRISSVMFALLRSKVPMNMAETRPRDFLDMSR